MRNLATNWTHWLEQAEAMPLPAFAVKNDDDLTLLGGNSAFFRLLGFSREEMQLRYGGRLGTVLDAQPFRTAIEGDIAPHAPVICTQRLFSGGSERERWLETQLFTSVGEEGLVLCAMCTDVTQGQWHKAQLTALEESLDHLTRQSNLDYFQYDLTTKEAKLCPSPTILPSLSPREDNLCHDFLHRLRSSQAIAPEWEEPLEKAFAQAAGEGHSACELRLNHGQKGPIWVRLTLSRKQNGQHLVGTCEDITQEREAARSYLSETQFYQALLSERTAYAQVDVDEDKITRTGGMWNLYNEIIHKVTYSQLIEEFINKVVHPEDRKHYLEVMQTANFLSSLESGIDMLGCEFRRIVDQNKMMWMELNVYLFRDPLTHHCLALLTITNIDAKKKQELQLLHNSRMDQLTNSFNRGMAEKLVREYLEHLQPKESFAFVVLDIDDFKTVNDTRGHAAGDQVLVQLSHMLSRTFRRSDVIGRFGGDEFIILMKNLEDRSPVDQRINRLYRSLRETKELGPISCSAGVAFVQGKITYEQLFHQADYALYLAKDAGKNCFVFYERAQEERPLPVPGPRHSEKMQGRMPPPDLMQDTTQSLPQQFHGFLGQEGDIAYLVNPATFDLLCGNQAFYDRLGLSEMQCTGKKCYELMHRRNSPCPFCSKANWTTDKFYLWRNLNLALEQEFLIKNKLVPWQNEVALLAIAVDISNNKSIVDSMENGATETHSILSGVQRMTESNTLNQAMESAMETIGCFFRADGVRLWRFHPETRECHCAYRWTHTGEDDTRPEDLSTLSKWLDSQSWEQPIVVESPEAMLSYSFDMYLYMKSHSIRNQRWVQVRELHETLGFLSIENISSNFQNIAFLESFSAFMAGELRKRSLMENALYADRHDDLTDLLSRKSFEGFMADYDPDQIACIGAVMANFNDLKGINSRRGFQAGNYLIQQFGDILRTAFSGYPLYRLNGDEFLAVLPDIARTALEEGLSTIDDLVKENGNFTVSIGHSWDDVEKDLSVLIEQATQGMKLNKKRHYDATPNTVDNERRKMLSDLITEIENRKFEIFLQPKVELVQGNVVGAEALIRYHHAEAGYIPPSQFIDILEKNNLIRYIDLFVFEEVCRLLESWKHRGLFLPVISLNFSRLTLLERDILAAMESIIQKYDVAKRHVEIEITESMASMGKSVLYQASCDLYKAGFSISLDDFGTKYTNLAILADLDFNVLKVDKSLIGELGKGDNHRLIMKNIVSMCHDLGIGVLAEGIESQDQEDILRSMECGLGQGYLYGKPMPVEEFDTKYMKTGSIN